MGVKVRATQTETETCKYKEYFDRLMEHSFLDFADQLCKSNDAQGLICVFLKEKISSLYRIVSYRNAGMSNIHTFVKENKTRHERFMCFCLEKRVHQRNPLVHFLCCLLQTKSIDAIGLN